MGAVNLPLNGAPLAQGLGYRVDAHPSNDAADIPANAGDTRIPDARGSRVGTNRAPEKPVEVLSLATKTVDANPHGARLQSNLKRDGWLDYMKPHVTPDE